VRLDDFRMEYYEGTDQPSTYESDVVLLADGQEVGKGMATVNKQVVYRGLALGQASWGLAGVKLTVQGPGKAEEAVEAALPQPAGPLSPTVQAYVDERQAVTIGDGEAALVADDLVPDTQTGGQYPTSPAVSLRIATGLEGGEHKIHDLGLLPRGEERVVEGYKVRFDDVVYVSTLSARRDPGLPLVWTGFILVSLGMAMMFYVRPRTFLVEVEESRKGATVRVAVAGREFADADRRIIESACEARLAPMAAAGKAASRRRASS